MPFSRTGGPSETTSLGSMYTLPSPPSLDPTERDYIEYVIGVEGLLKSQHIIRKFAKEKMHNEIQKPKISQLNLSN